MDRTEAPRRSKVTIADVARAAGVSVGTVSHIMSGKKGVSEVRRRRVLDAVKQLGYIPNVHAQGLRTATSKIIGLCLPHGSTYYLNALANELEDAASEQGYSILHIFSRQDPDIELKRIKDLLRFRVDGLVIFPTAEAQPSLDFLNAKSVPTVLVDRSNGDERFDQITLDNTRAMEEVARHLIGRGHRHILFVFRSITISVTAARMVGLERAVAQAPEPVQVSLLEAGRGEDLLTDQLARFTAGPNRATAVVVSNSSQAARVLISLKQMQIRIPEDMSVVAFDDTDWSQLVDPPLATVRQPARNIARTAFQLLLDRIARRDIPPQIMSMRPEFVPRGSVGDAPDRS